MPMEKLIEFFSFFDFACVEKWKKNNNEKEKINYEKLAINWTCRVIIRGQFTSFF